MNRSFPLVAAMAVAVAAPAVARTPYHPRESFRIGWSDQRLGPDRWQVRGASRDAGGSIAVAIRHAAEIGRRAGLAELRVVRQRVTRQRLVRRDGSIVASTEVTLVTIRAVRSDADRMSCEMSDARRCLTLPVAGVLLAYGERIGRRVAWASEPATPARLIVFPAKALMADRGLPAAVPLPALPGPPRASTMMAADMRPAAPRVLPAVAAPRAPRPPFPATFAPTYEDRMRAARPVSSDPRLGWTATD